jgi:hypothetical protein
MQNISVYTKRLARLAVDRSTPMAPVPISTTRASGFDVSKPKNRVICRADEAASRPPKQPPRYTSSHNADNRQRGEQQQRIER